MRHSGGAPSFIGGIGQNIVANVCASALGAVCVSAGIVKVGDSTSLAAWPLWSVIAGAGILLWAGNNLCRRAKTWLARAHATPSPGGQISVLLAQLEGDDEHCSRQAEVAAAIERRFGEGIAVTTWPESLRLQAGSNRDRHSKALKTVRRWLRHSGCSVLIWGHVKGPRALALRISNSADLGTELTYTLSEVELELADLLPETVSVGVFTSVVSESIAKQDISIASLGKTLDRLVMMLDLNLSHDLRLGVLACLGEVKSLLGDFSGDPVLLRQAAEHLNEAESLVSQATSSELVACLSMLRGQNLIRLSYVLGDYSQIDGAMVSLRKSLICLDRDKGYNAWVRCSMLVADLFYVVGSRNLDSELMQEAADLSTAVTEPPCRNLHPHLWAGGKQTSGRCSVAIGLVESKPSHLRQAVKEFDDALEVVDRLENPVGWAWMNKEKAIALLGLFDISKDFSTLRSAISCLQAAITEPALKDRRDVYAIAKLQLALCLVYLFADTEDEGLLVRAMRLCAAADTSGLSDATEQAATIECQVYGIAGFALEDPEVIDVGIAAAVGVLASMTAMSSGLRLWALHGNLGMAFTFRALLSGNAEDRLRAIKESEEALVVAQRMGSAGLCKASMDCLKARRTLLRPSTTRLEQSAPAPRIPVL